MTDAPVIPVRGDIKLGQFLKLAGLAEDGVMARELIQDGDVTINGEVDTRRGHTLSPGDLVEVFSPHGPQAARVGPSQEPPRPRQS
ncbi:RNA-binding S4 domain-containing protein [Schaalia sp. ZJ1691]|uniref:RNA-binding S4 domain-containing protein n=1 Tax=Schaalia sp. ZJ1691 TaxID=2709404 RepID=UPI0013EA25D9|nr:RNA-binding S4 domain-containing protein [Schaalia sp. ZJ1691]